MLVIIQLLGRCLKTLEYSFRKTIVFVFMHLLRNRRCYLRNRRSRVLPEASKAGMDDSNTYKFKPFLLTEIAFADQEQVTEADLPRARSGHRIVCTQDALYSFGGFNPEMGDQQMFGELWRFDLKEYKWELLLDKNYSGMPTALASMAVWGSGSSFLIFGGSGLPFGEHNSNKLHYCETQQLPPSIREIETTGEMPPALYGQSMVVHEQYLYVVGGTSGFEYSSDVFRLDLTTRVWQLMCKSQPQIEEFDPEPRYRHELAVDEHYIYMLGGGTSSDTFDLETVPAYDLAANKWTMLATKPDATQPQANSFPRPRKFHTLVQVDDQVIVSGGCNEQEYLRDMWRLDLRHLRWHRIRAQLPYKLFFHGAAVTPEGCMFIFAGIRGRTGLTRTNNLYKVWLKVPKLRAICADAVRQMMRTDETTTRQRLSQMWPFDINFDRTSFMASV